MSNSNVRTAIDSHLKRRKLDAVLCADRINAVHQVINRLILVFGRVVMAVVVV